MNRKLLLLCTSTIFLSSCGNTGGSGRITSGPIVSPPPLFEPLPEVPLTSSKTRIVTSIEGFDIYRLSGLSPKINWSDGPWKKATIDSIKIDPSASILRPELFLDQLQVMVNKVPKGKFEKAPTPKSDSFGILLTSGNEVTFGESDPLSKRMVHIFLAEKGVLNMEKTGGILEIKELKTSKGVINVKAGILRIDTASLQSKIHVTGTGSLEFSQLKELPGEYLYQEIISDGDQISAKGRPILNNNSWRIQNSSLVEGEIVNKGTLTISSGSRVFGNIENSGQIVAKNSSISGNIQNQKTRNVSFEKVTMLGYFDNQGIVEMSGGEFSGKVINSGKFELKSDGIPMSGDFTNEVGALFIPRSVNMSGNITNHGKFQLDYPMHVKQFHQPSSGEIRIVLSDDNLKAGTPYLQASEDIVISAGSISFSYIGKSEIKKNAKYKLFSSKSKAPVVKLNLEYVLKDPIQKDMINLEVVGQDYIVTFLEAVNKKVKRVSLPLMRKGRDAFHSYLQRNIATDFRFKSVGLKDGLSFTVREEKIGQNYTFMAMNQELLNSSYGLYAGYELGAEKVMDVGVYGINKLGALKFTNNLHVSKSSTQDHETNQNLYGITTYSELSLPCEKSHIIFSPKIMAGYNNATSFEDDEEGVWFGGIGLDISSKFNLKSLPVEIFSSFNLIHNDESITENASHIKLGFKVKSSDVSKIYGNVKIQSEGVNTIETGLNLRINP